MYTVIDSIYLIKFYDLIDRKSTCENYRHDTRSIGLLTSMLKYKSIKLTNMVGNNVYAIYTIKNFIFRSRHNLIRYIASCAIWMGNMVPYIKGGK